MTAIGKLLQAIRTMIRPCPAQKSLSDWASEMQRDNDKQTKARMHH